MSELTFPRDLAIIH